MKDNQEIVINDDDDGSTPPRKKLKQARLPFQVLSPVVKPASDQSAKKKRKLSEGSDIKAAKIVKCDKSDVPLEAKENVCASVKTEKNENNCKVAKSVKENEHSAIKEDEKPPSLDKKREGRENSVDHSKTKNVKKPTNDNEPCQTENSVTQVCDSKNSDTKVVVDLCEEDDNVTPVSKSVDSLKLKDSTKTLTGAAVSAKQDDSVELKIEEKEDSDARVQDDTKKHTDDKLESSEKPESEESSEEPENEESSDEPENEESSEKLENDESVQKDDVTPLKKRKNDSDSGSIKGSTDKKLRERKSAINLLTPKNDKSATSPEVTPKSKKLTPKQLQKQAESAKKREEKERQRLERERKKAEEKEEKQRQKIEKEEQKRKEKEEKEEQRKKEKEEKEKKRLAELEVKLEEKKLKEEERRKKEEQRLLEKKKKDEKKQAEEDAKRKVAAAFTSYFLSRKSDSKPLEEIKDRPSETFMPFEVKSDMRLAPLCRVKFETEQRKYLDTFLCEQSESCNYLKDLRNKVRVPGTSTSTWPVSEKSDVVVLDDVEDDEIIDGADNQVVELHPDINLPRPKLLQFWDNRRPPYWGTWRKKSSVISQRKPFNKDEKLFDYEVDSDDEWEEEEPGESLHGSDDEKESEDEYEVDNDFFVPHGYLSDEENLHGDDEDTETVSPETQKAKLKLLEHEFEEEMKQKTERLKPRIIGCIWTHKSNDAVGSQLLKLLSSRRAVYRDGPIITSKPEDTPKTGASNGDSDPVARRPKKRRFPDSAVPALIKLIHGNTNGIIFLVKEFITYYRKMLSSETDSSEQKESEKKETETPLPISKNSTSKKIRELASWTTCPDEGPLLGRNCWYVPAETRAAHGLPDLTAGNKQWEYNLKPRRREPVEVSPVTSPVAVATEPKVSMSITKFTKKLSREECQKQLKQEEQPQPETKPSFGIKTFLIKPSESQPVQKKRVPILASAARGQKLPQARHIIPKKSVDNEIDKCNITDKCKVESKSLSDQTHSQVNGRNTDVNSTASTLGVKEEKVSVKVEKSTEHCKEIICIDLDD